MHPFATTAIVGGATYALTELGYVRLPMQIQPVVIGDVEGGAYYRWLIYRLRETTGILTARTAREVFEGQRLIAVSKYGAGSLFREYPAAGMRNSEYLTLIEGWLKARQLTASQIGTLDGENFFFWVGGKRFTSEVNRKIAERWNLHAGAVVSGMAADIGMASYDLTIRHQIASEQAGLDTWRALSDYATYCDTLVDAEPEGGFLEEGAKGLFGGVYNAVGAIGRGAVDALLSSIGGGALKIALVAGAGYLLYAAVKR